MTKRKYDYEAIVESYNELKTIRAVSETLNVPRMTVRAAVYKALGKCVQCASPVIPGRDVCEDHERYRSDRIAKRRKERRRLGLCQDCDEPYELPSMSYCKEHRSRHINDNDKYRQKTDVRRKNSSHEVKLYNIRKKYGESGIQCYENAKGTCEICHRGTDEVKIHIHHINCDETDHRLDNLICLCFDHHTATHRILEGTNQKEFVKWFSQTYLAEQLNEQTMNL